MYAERLQKLRAEMKKRGITCYLIPTADFHESEYVGDYFKARRYITGFTGSAGTAVVTPDEAGLWTDGRYFLQAEDQLKGHEFTLYRIGEEGVPTIPEFLRDHLSEGGVLGFDGRVINLDLYESLAALAEAKGAGIASGEDLVDLVWEDRPALSCRPVFALEEKYTGKSAADKIGELRGILKEKGAKAHLLTSLPDIAWLLNLRGDDVAHSPVILSYLALTENDCLWFVQEEALSPSVRDALSSAGVDVRPYGSFYEYLSSLPAGIPVLLDPGTVNSRIASSLPKDAKLIREKNPTALMKAVKNPVEIENTRRAHLKDAIAVTKFMIWLKNNVGKIPMTEISAADRLEAFRRENEGFLELSFSTIAGYGPHGAIIHYGATPESDLPLAPEGFLLVDSGAHYLEGTTDITRTFALGPVTDRMRRDFTLVLIGHLNLASARFLYGAGGYNLDVLARLPLWEEGLDYKHGTGHGVGHILSVHEGPNAFRWKSVPGKAETVLEEGMITSDEPGYYLENQYGIRIESELLCRKADKNEFGQFMCFENLTYVPIDLDAVEPSLLTSRDKARLNAYHASVYEKVSPFLTPAENEILKEYTRAI